MEPTQTDLSTLYQWHADRAEKCFLTHTARATTVGWLLRNPAKSAYACEIAMLDFGDILVHGDVPPLLFRGSAGNQLSRLDWLSDSEPDYLVQKVKLGQAMRFEPDVARFQLDEWKSNGDTKVLSGLRDAMLLLDRGEAGPDGYELRRVLHEVLDAEKIAHIGMAINLDIFMAIAAAKRVQKHLNDIAEHDP